MKNKYVKELENVIFQNATNQKNTQQKIYEILICILIFTPIIAAIVFGVMGKIFTVILVLIVCALLLVILFNIRKKTILLSFYKIKDAYGHCNIIKVDDLLLLDKMYRESALTTMSADSLVESGYLNIIYNWLNNLECIKGDKLDVYTFTGKEIKEKYGYNVGDKINVICIPLGQLDINDENLKQLGEQHFAFKTRYFDDMIDNFRK